VFENGWKLELAGIACPWPTDAPYPSCLEPLTQPLIRRCQALSYYCTACGLAPSLNRKPSVCWVVLATLSMAIRSVAHRPQRRAANRSLAGAYCQAGAELAGLPACWQTTGWTMGADTHRGFITFCLTNTEQRLKSLRCRWCLLEVTEAGPLACLLCIYPLQERYPC
jgi:hypothetical protein